MKKKIMAALLAGVMLLQQPVSGWCAQNTELTQKSEARQESEAVKIRLTEVRMTQRLPEQLL